MATLQIRLGHLQRVVQHAPVDARQHGACPDVVAGVHRQSEYFSRRLGLDLHGGYRFDDASSLDSDDDVAPLHGGSLVQSDRFVFLQVRLAK